MFNLGCPIISHNRHAYVYSIDIHGTINPIKYLSESRAQACTHSNKTHLKHTNKPREDLLLWSEGVLGTEIFDTTKTVFDRQNCLWCVIWCVIKACPVIWSKNAKYDIKGHFIKNIAALNKNKPLCPCSYWCNSRIPHMGRMKKHARSLMWCHFHYGHNVHFVRSFYCKALSESYSNTKGTSPSSFEMCSANFVRKRHAVRLEAFHQRIRSPLLQSCPATHTVAHFRTHSPPPYLRCDTLFAGMHKCTWYTCSMKMCTLQKAWQRRCLNGRAGFELDEEHHVWCALSSKQQEASGFYICTLIRMRPTSNVHTSCVTRISIWKRYDAFICARKCC